MESQEKEKPVPESTTRHPRPSSFRLRRDAQRVAVGRHRSRTMPFSTLISAAQLVGHLDDPTLVVVDCRFNLDDVEWGRREYASAHIPGAVYAHVDEDMAGAKSGTNGRHPLPDPESFRRALGRMGISHASQVVAYDQDNGMYASRFWWMLRWMGHDAVAVLDGGMAAWLAEGQVVASGEERRARAEFSGEPRDGMLASGDDVASMVARPDWRVLDARAPERFRGEVEPLDRVAGHIPGARNHFFQSNLEADATFRSREALQASFEAVLGGTPADHVVAYCGSGVTACHNLLAMEHAGLHGARLYAGSWSEWSSNTSRPIATGPTHAHDHTS